jgi:hypothetical protein
MIRPPRCGWPARLLLAGSRLLAGSSLRSLQLALVLVDRVDASFMDFPGQRHSWWLAAATELPPAALKAVTRSSAISAQLSQKPGYYYRVAAMVLYGLRLAVYSQASTAADAASARPAGPVYTGNSTDDADGQVADRLPGPMPEAAGGVHTGHSMNGQPGSSKTSLQSDAGAQNFNAIADAVLYDGQTLAGWLSSGQTIEAADAATQHCDLHSLLFSPVGSSIPIIPSTSKHHQLAAALLCSNTFKADLLLAMQSHSPNYSQQMGLVYAALEAVLCATPDILTSSRRGAVAGSAVLSLCTPELLACLVDWAASECLQIAKVSHSLSRTSGCLAAVTELQRALHERAAGMYAHIAIGLGLALLPIAHYVSCLAICLLLCAAAGGVGRAASAGCGGGPALAMHLLWHAGP